MPAKTVKKKRTTKSNLVPAKPGSKATREQAAAVAIGLANEYGDAECALVHRNAFELLIATILSAQCTDVRVNMVTPALFKKWPTPEAIARAEVAELERAIQSTGFFRNKARNILGCCGKLVQEHGGEVPQTLAELVELPGIGRKTANVVLGTAFGIPSGVVVDTHVTRLCYRLGLTKQTNAVKIEQDLIQLLPPDEWINFSHRLIHHGRRICNARKPRCGECILLAICPRVGVEEK
ncbi:MAG: endonuclease III [Pirellulaceae bacterium]|nr:endonuclease III [Pirellulaceae bacterium]